MRSPRWRFGVLTALVGILAWCVPVEAHVYSPSHSWTSCDTGSGNHYLNYQYSVSRPIDTGPTTANLVSATAVIDDPIPCSSPDAGQTGVSIVNVVNLEDFSAGGGFIQFGYGILDCGGTLSTCNGFSDNALDFWWTGVNDVGGTISAATWIDFNGGGHDRPMTGESYTFTIERDVYMGLAKWKYTVKANTGRFAGISKNHIQDRTWSIGNGWWYSFEVYGTASAMGNVPGDTVGWINPMSYRDASTQVTWWLTDTPNYAFLPNFVDWYTPQFILDNNGRGKLNVYTPLHTT